MGRGTVPESVCLLRKRLAMRFQPTPPTGRPWLVTALPKLAMLAVILAVPGCMGVANLMHAVGLDMIPAEYEGLQDATVAIVATTDSSLYSTDAAATELSQRLAHVFSTEVDDIRLVRHDKVQSWRDAHGYDSADYVDLGRDLNADRVVVVDLKNLQLRDGPTLYRGRADVSLEVIDVESAAVAFTKNLDEYTFPKMTGQYTSETTESKFRKFYLTMLAKEIGRSFHRFDHTDQIAMDGKMAGF